MLAKLAPPKGYTLFPGRDIGKYRSSMDKVDGLCGGILSVKKYLFYCNHNKDIMSFLIIILFGSVSIIFYFVMRDEHEVH